MAVFLLKAVVPTKLAPMWRLAFVGLVAALVLVGCGGGGQTESEGKTPSIQEVASCLEKNGATIGRILEEETGIFEMVFAVTPEVTFNIANLSEADRSKRMIRFMENAKSRAGIEGKLVTTVVNEGFTVVGVVAAPETGDPLPSAESERLGKECATLPNGAGT
jgi:hypothetical protein